MEIEEGGQIGQLCGQYRNKINLWNRLLGENRQSQNKLEDFTRLLKGRLAELQDQFSEKKLSEIEVRLNQCKEPVESIFQLEMIKKPNYDVQFVRKLVGERDASNANTKMIKWKENPKMINFVAMAEQHNTSGIDLYRRWRNKMKFQGETPEFTGNQLFQLEVLVEKFGKNWEKVSGYFQNRSVLEVEKAFHKFRKKHVLERGRWNLRQNIILITLVEHIGEGKWAAIAKILSQKTDVMIRERFCNILNPQLSKTVWSDFQQQELMRKAPEYEYSWSKMVSELVVFKDKTDNALRRKYRSLLIDKPEDQIKKHLHDNQTLMNAIIRNKNHRSKEKKILMLQPTKKLEDDS